MKKVIYKQPEIYDLKEISDIINKILKEYRNLTEEEMKNKLILLSKEVAAQTMSNLGIIE